MKLMRNLSVLALTAAIGGCASLGEDSYGCKGLPAGSTCMSTLEIYEETKRKDNLEINYAEEDDSSFGWFGSKKKAEPTADKAPVDEELMVRIMNQKRFINSIVPDAKGTVPIRMQAQVIRFWVKDHATKDGQWNSESFHFRDIEPRRWTSGEMQAPEPRVLRPIQVVESAVQTK